MKRLQILAAMLLALITGNTLAQNPEVDYEKQVVNVAGHYNLNILPSPKKLTTFPVAVCKIPYLNVVNLVSHDITSIPPEIGNIKALTVLNMPNNKLTSIPKEIGQLTNLKSLNLNKNMITGLPDELGNCVNLKSLIISDNNIPQADIDKIQKMLPNCVITNVKSGMPVQKNY
ncbi:MAG: leucine-rich repeat domain-containing protein [Cytophagaceae bacterium]